MSSKACVKCEIIKPFSDYYKCNHMMDGCVNKCKECVKIESKERLAVLRQDPEWLEQERKRARDKYYRLGYVEKKKSAKEIKNTQTKYNKTYPEKNRARNASFKIKPMVKGNEMHHWSYRPENKKDVIELSKKAHMKAHRFIVYDQERMMYRRFDTNELLDTREAHEAFIIDCINNRPD